MRILAYLVGTAIGLILLVAFAGAQQEPTATHDRPAPAPAMATAIPQDDGVYIVAAIGALAALFVVAPASFRP